MLSLFAKLFGRNTEHLVDCDITNGREKNKIPAVSYNCRDVAPNDYHYVTEDVENTPMSVDRSLGSMNSCNCEDDCSANKCKCTNSYNTSLCYRDGKLSPEYNMDQPEVIYECNIGCKCKQDRCQNRVIQRGTDLKLLLFKTQNRGWGVRTMRTIKKGAFIGIYSGELITTEESCKRIDDTYLFNLSFSRRTQNEQQYVCDAKFFGNFTRFINHSCQPNVIGIRSFTMHQDSRFPHIAFFALEKIPAKQELTLNYGDNYWLVKCKRDKQYCLCKNAICRFTKRTFPSTYREAIERKRKEEAEAKQREEEQEEEEVEENSELEQDDREVEQEEEQEEEEVEENSELEQDDREVEQGEEEERELVEEEEEEEIPWIEGEEQVESELGPEEGEPEEQVLSELEPEYEEEITNDYEQEFYEEQNPELYSEQGEQEFYPEEEQENQEEGEEEEEVYEEEYEEVYEEEYEVGDYEDEEFYVEKYKEEAPNSQSDKLKDFEIDEAASQLADEETGDCLYAA